jgi:hypothetical protein
MKYILLIACGIIAAISGCRGPDHTDESKSEGTPSGVSIVDEIYGLSQGLDTDGKSFTVRGWLVSDNEGDGYKLYNASWDPFDPRTKDGIPHLALKFTNYPPSEYWVGQYVNVSGRVVTEVSADGHRTVTLDEARVVSAKIKDGQVIPYRTKQAEQYRHPTE